MIARVTVQFLRAHQYDDDFNATSRRKCSEPPSTGPCNKIFFVCLLFMGGQFRQTLKIGSAAKCSEDFSHG